MKHTAARFASPYKTVWLVPLVLLVNLSVFGLLLAYSFLNLLPDLPAAHRLHPETYFQLAVVLVVIAPTAASTVFLWPLFRWVRRGHGDRAGTSTAIPSTIAHRSMNAPLALAAFSLVGWLLFTTLVAASTAWGGSVVPSGHVTHFVSRPALAGLIAATAIFFAAEHLCRTRVWSSILATTKIDGDQQLWRVRVWHRLLGLWLVVGALPLGAIALTTLARVNSADPTTEPVFDRLANVVLLISFSAAAGGALIAWIVARSITGPLEVLESATARLSAGSFDTRVPVNATDEFGSLAEGFNLAAQRLSHMVAELESRNRELALALDRVIFLEHVKRGLDRFVPDTVRLAIEKNPQAPGLSKKTQDLTVLFLDIEGYTRLSEELPRSSLNALVERYFSLFLTTIRAQGGDINETAGDGLMIIFQSKDQSEHASAAVRAAMFIKEQTRIANSAALAGHPPIAVNIGISSGDCDVGATRFAGPAGERWTFTASGFSTNLAARLGDHAKGGQILLAAQTAQRIHPFAGLRRIGPVELKNLSDPVEVWEIA